MAKKRSRNKKNNFKKTTEYNAIPSIISNNVYNNENLSSGAKILWGMINFLSRPEDLIYHDPKPVYASNRYFYTQLGRNSKYSNRAIQGYIKDLKDEDLVEVTFVKGIRYILPKSVTRHDSHIACYIPGEVVKDSRLSVSRKLTYGLLNWKSGNINRYYNTTVEDLAEETNRHRSTIYRHLEQLKKLKYLTTSRDGRTLSIYCDNSFQDTLEAKRIEKSGEEQKFIEERNEQMTNAPPSHPEMLKWVYNFVNARR